MLIDVTVTAYIIYQYEQHNKNSLCLYSSSKTLFMNQQFSILFEISFKKSNGDQIMHQTF